MIPSTARGLFLLFLFMDSGLAARLPLPQAETSPPEVPGIQLFFDLADRDRNTSRKAARLLSEAWRDDYSILIVELMTVMVTGKDRKPVRRLTNFLEDRTGKRFGEDIGRWQLWAWSRPFRPHPHYAFFKGVLYGALDSRMKDFFPHDVPSTIRLDQVEWGGVKVNGIPPLDHPSHIDADKAGYLDDGDLVIGLSVNGQARAYPKRIVAWHEMVLDRLAERDITLVFCSLCGTAIPYESRIHGRLLTFGTSGFLYRSNKLMFDSETRTLWSSLQGIPVVGPMVGSGLQLQSLPVVTTTWGEWRAAHPETTVLSLDTGFERDYSEGAAYRDYFSTDELMFQVPERDDRLKNKDEVLVVRFTGDVGARLPVAIESGFLRENPVFHFSVDPGRYVVLTTPRGASRVYQSSTVMFEGEPENGRIQDSTGQWWRIREEGLESEASGEKLPRVPAQSVFWFGWYAQHPDTKLLPE